MVKQSGKERATDIPSWALGQQPHAGESGLAFADRLLVERYGPERFPTAPGSEHNKLREFGDRNRRG